MAFGSLKSMFLFNFIIRYILESFLEILLCSIINLYSVSLFFNFLDSNYLNKWPDFLHFSFYLLWTCLYVLHMLQYFPICKKKPNPRWTLCKQNRHSLWGFKHREIHQLNKHSLFHVKTNNPCSHLYIFKRLCLFLSLSSLAFTTLLSHILLSRNALYVWRQKQARVY